MYRLCAARDRIFASALLVVVATGCEKPPVESIEVARGALGAASFTFTLPIPAGVDPAAIVIGVADRVAVADRSIIDPSAAGGPRPVVSNTGTTQSSFGVDTQDSGRHPQQSVGLPGRARGGIGRHYDRRHRHTPERHDRRRAIPEHQTIPIAPVSWTVAFPASSMAVSLEPGQTRSISPGAYTDVNVKSGAILTLTSPGTYFFDSLNVEPNGGRVVLNGNGPFTIYVRASLTLKGPLVRPAGAPPVATMLAYAGSNSVYLSAPFQGSLVAPGATLTLADIGTGIHEASFFARASSFRRPFTSGIVPPLSVHPRRCIPPAPGGEFRCALLGRSQAVLGTSQTSSLLGTASLTLKANGSFTLDLLDARGSSVCSGANCSKVSLRPDPAAVNVGSFSTSDGTLQINLAAVVRFTDRSNHDSSVALAVTGQLQHRRLSAFATGSMPPDSPLFAGAPMTVAITCDQQEPRQIVETSFNVDAAGTISASGTSVRVGNRPVLPLQGQGFVLIGARRTR